MPADESLIDDLVSLLTSSPERWVDVQSDIVDAAADVDNDARQRLARALLDAIALDARYGPDNPLTPAAFDLVVTSADGALAELLARPSSELPQASGARFVYERLWSVPGPQGAVWLRRLAAREPIRVSFMYQDMATGALPRWADEDWPARIDALAESLDRHATVLRLLGYATPPATAGPALVRLATRHGNDETDPIVRDVAGCVRRWRTGDAAADARLFDWEARHTNFELFRWIVELAGGVADRASLVAVAPVGSDAAFLAARLERPPWADGPVPWVVGDVVDLGAIALTDRRLAGGDPWKTGADDGFPWTIDTGADHVVVRIVVAVHPLGGRECAAIEALVADRGPVVEWVPEASYGTAVGAAGVGAPAAVDTGAVFDIDPPMSPAPRWHTLASEGTAVPDLALCTVGPQGQRCRTWTGRDSSGRVAAVVTDLGLLEIDLAIDAVRPWDAPTRESR